MNSQYDSIKTASDLVKEVVMHGLSTNQDDQNRAADIIGNAPITELIYLANDIGRNNEKGQPDPKGSWSSARKGMQEAFYMILFTIWNWREATAFYNKHSNPLFEEAGRAIEERNDLKAMVASMSKKIEQATISFEELESTNDSLNEHNKDMIQMIKRLKTENVILKAKLYDLISKEDEI